MNSTYLLKKEGMQYRNQNTERSPRLPRKYLFRLNTRQFICSVLAVGVAVGIYFALQPYVGTEEIGWMCILGAAPFAACGFFTYHGMTAEQVLWAWFKSEILCPKRLEFKSDSYYYEAMQPAIRAGMKRKRGKPMKKNTHDSEETA